MGRVVAVLAVIATFLGGCSSGQSDYDLAMQENTQLREQLASLQQQVNEANERARLASESGGDGSLDFGDGTQTRRGAQGELIVDIAGDVLFDSGSVVLKNSAKATLDRIAAAISSQFGSNIVRVEGYTDADPIKKSGWKTNERLSAERAMAVETYLVSKGVNNDRIYSAAFGPARQKGTKADSRRVEIVILDASS